jgi:hypothetical protein
MQLLARFIEFATALPRPIAATAMAAPTMARMRAYSAAAAPDSSRIMFMKVFNFLVLVWGGEEQQKLRLSST